MKVALLYGPGEVGKRDQLVEFKSAFKGEVVVIDLKTQSLAELDNILHAISLFDTAARLIVAENTPESLDLTKIQNALADGLVLLAGNLKSSSKLLESAKEVNAKIYSFEGEKEVTAFAFLDMLIEKDKGAFRELEKLFNEFGGVYILMMIAYGLRRNILPLPSSSFAAGKITRQRVNFSMDDWQRLYKMVLDTEYRIKSGVVPERLGLTFLTHSIIES